MKPLGQFATSHFPYPVQHICVYSKGPSPFSTPLINGPTNYTPMDPTVLTCTPGLFTVFWTTSTQSSWYSMSFHNLVFTVHTEVQ